MSKQSGPAWMEAMVRPSGMLGALVHYAQTVRHRVHRYTMSRQSGVSPAWMDAMVRRPAAACWAHWYAMSKQSGGRYAAPGAPVHYEQTVRPWVHRYSMSRQSGVRPRAVLAPNGYTGTL
jgi:hypothetical protein